MPLRFDQPEYLWLLLLAVPVVWLGFRSLATLDPVRRWTAITLRVLVLTLLVVMLAGVQSVRWHTDLTVVAVLDESESILRFATPPPPPVGTTTGDAPPTIDEWMRSWVLDATHDHHVDDKLGWIGFDGRPTVRAMPGAVSRLDSGAIDQPREGTDTAAALRLGLALFPPDSGKRLLLASDGDDTGPGAETDNADLLAAAREAKAAGVPIDVLPIEYRVEHEAMVEGVYAPTEAREGQTVAVRVVLNATEPTPGTLHLRHDGYPMDLNGNAPGNGAAIAAADWSSDNEPGRHGRWVCVRMIDAPMASAGVNRFEAVFEPLKREAVPTDTMAANNRAETFTLVHGKSRVLFVDNVGGESGSVLPRVLRDRGIQMDVVSGWEVPGNLADLQRYDAVVLQNVPAEMVVPAQQKMIARYVSDMGGGLVMIGGPESFGAGGWTNSPIDRILPVECQIPSQTILPAGALVIVIDRSGSMTEGVTGTTASKLELAREAAIQAITTLYPDDMVGVIVFDSEPHWIVPLRVNSNPGDSIATVRRVESAGGTDIYPALVAATSALKTVTPDQAGIKHIILLTDGESNDGDYIGIVKEMVRHDISLSTVGIGNGVNGQLLSQLALMAGGNYHPISDPTKLPQVFIKEARVVRKNLVRETPFKPGLIATGSPVMAGIAAVPQLKGLVLTGPKRDPRVFMPIVGPEGEPVFAHWQVGLGRTAAFTSDATNRWATEWMAWGGYSDFWTRTLRAVARPSASREFDLLTHIDGDRMRVRLDAAAAAPDTAAGAKNRADFDNFLTVSGSVLNPDGSASQVTLQQTGPGLYEAQIPATAQGNYIVSLFAQAPDGTRRAIFGGASRPPGAELRRFSSNRAVLEEVARISGGRILDPAQPQAASLFGRQNITPSRSIRPLWWPLLFVLVALFLLDVGCRRIAWDVFAIARWVNNHYLGITDRFRTREVQGEATLAALKARAARVDQRLAATPAQPAERTTPVLEPAIDASRKFDADEMIIPVEEISEALGGAAVSDTHAPPTPKPRGLAEPQEATTSRLLNAKRRAQQRDQNDQGDA
ncbi:MAG: VWA domain-containing protein [Planctomycetes bacterium]|nr:VWA domain-containing protein [Planctomycetota bacterium]